MSTLTHPRTRTALVVLALVVLFVALFLAPFYVPLYYMSIVTRIVIVGAFAVAFNIVFGLGGMPSLGHAAFFGLGGYVVGLGVTRWDWGLGTILLGLVVVGAGLGLVLGVLCQRVNGIYLLLMTLAVGQAIYGLAFQNARITGGDMGISGVFRDVLPFEIASRQQFHQFAVIVCVAVMALLWWFMLSPMGRAIIGLRESESRMGSLGYNAGIYKAAAFVVSGLACSFLGALYAMQRGFVGIDGLEWTLSATVLLAAIVGGSRFFLGPFIGIAAIIIIEAFFQEYTERYTTILGLFYILTILILPQGILGIGRTRKAPTDEPAQLEDHARPTEREAVS
ncbi:branched-chain amino acid ABC transporter permease [Nocardioides pyridinolyticus]